MNWISYAWNNCTQFVAKNFSWIPPFLGDAKDWLTTAPQHGLQTTHTPAPGEVAVMTQVGGGHGHVGIVKSVNANGTITLNDQNWDMHGTIMTHDVSASSITGYIVPPGGVVPSGGVGPIALPNPGAVQSFFTTLNIQPNEFLIRGGFIAVGLILVAIGLVVAFKQEGTVAHVAAAAALA